MKALVKSRATSGLWMEDVQYPEAGSSDVLIRVQKVGICGTDLHIYNWDQWAQATIPIPLITGHEFVGVVEKVGESVVGVKVGDRVSGEGHIACKKCRNCRAGRQHLCINTEGVGINRNGAFAEYLVIPASNVYVLPDTISNKEAAILDPFGNAVHTALSYDLVGEDVLITGAGPIGIMAAAVCRHVGARNIVVTDFKPDRLRLAEEMGATMGVCTKDINLDDVMKKLGMREGFDVGLEMSGSGSALSEMIKVMNHAGKISLLGIFSDSTRINLNVAIFKGLTFKCIYGREMFETWYKMISMIESGLDISSVITHELPFEDFEEGFSVLNKGEACKVVLNLTT